MEDREARDARRQPEDQPGRELLRGASPREILAKLMAGDPLELRARCQARQRERAQLMSLDRLVAKAFALTARAAVNYRDDPPLDAWLAIQVDLALDHALVEDESGGVEDRHFDFAASVWNVEPEIARQACVVFNALPAAVRGAYWAVVLEGKTIHRYVAEGHGPPQFVKKRVERAITAMGTLSDPGGVDGPSRRPHGS